VVIYNHRNKENKLEEIKMKDNRIVRAELLNDETKKPLLDAVEELRKQVLGESKIKYPEQYVVEVNGKRYDKRFYKGAM
jgi:hypothetical protein